jgi:2-polyprenyl-3-methyl-5-hydroxy-6-metoxy-1,4-benzoquinol methylase
MSDSTREQGHFDLESIHRLKESMKATWMAGDFGVVARTISSGAEQFIARIGVPPGSRVLDVACGTGNLAIPLARRGCRVTGVDIATNLLEQARERAAAEGLKAVFDEGDAEHLPYPDATFDAVVSMFGAMFAPRPELVASELARVLKPGGLLAMANWNPESFSGKLFKVSAGHHPASAAHAPAVPPPVLWGDDATVRSRLAPFFTKIETALIPIEFDLPTSPAGAVAFFRSYFGPTNVAFSRLDQAGQARFSADLEALWAGANVAPDPATHTLVHNQYLQVAAVRL